MAQTVATRVLDVIEDYALLSHAISCIAHAVTSEDSLPIYLPELHDAVTAENISIIVQRLSEIKK